MRKIYVIVISFAILAIGYQFWTSRDARSEYGEAGEENLLEDFKGALEDRLFTTSDVDLGYIPYDKLINAVLEGQRRAELRGSERSGRGLTNAIWNERGPNNVGGRTRA